MQPGSNQNPELLLTVWQTGYLSPCHHLAWATFENHEESTDLGHKGVNFVSGRLSQRALRGSTWTSEHCGLALWDPVSCFDHSYAWEFKTPWMFIHSFIQQMFVKRPLCVLHCSGNGKTEKGSFYIEQKRQRYWVRKELDGLGQRNAYEWEWTELGYK